MNIVVVGAGWLGSAIAARSETSPIPRRAFRTNMLPTATPVIVASGRSSVDRREGLAGPLDEELAHLRAVLADAARARSPRVVVLGSSDVAGAAAVIRGSTPADPLTVYARVKAEVEAECLRWRARGLDVVAVRLAPVHGAGKARTRQLLRLALLPATPLPNGGRHSVGFVLRDDAVEAVIELARSRGPGAVVAVGAGHTPLRALLAALADARARRLRVLPVPAPSRLLRALPAARLSDRANWVLRLAVPRSVEMEVSSPVTPLGEAARHLASLW